MASTTTQIQIVNRSLQLLGSRPISNIQENSTGARAMNRAYQPVLLSELRKRYWGFSIKRIEIAAAATGPIFGKANYFPLPGDYLQLAPPDNNYETTAIIGPPGLATFTGQNDWQIENTGNGLAIASDETSSIQVRYVSSAITESMFDVLFAEGFAVALALETCEEVTQSNTKLMNLGKLYDSTMGEAQKRNAFEMQPVRAPIDSWITRRF